MFRVLKRSLCVFLSFTVLVFSCVFMPKQKAEALSEVGIIGTVGGLVSLGLLLYGVCVNDPYPLQTDDSLSAYYSDYLSLLGLGEFSPGSPLYISACNGLDFLKGAKDLANTAYETVFCPLEKVDDIVPGKFFTVGQTGAINLNFTGDIYFSVPDSEVDIKFTNTKAIDQTIFCYYYSFGGLYFLSSTNLNETGFSYVAHNKFGTVLTSTYNNTIQKSYNGKMYYLSSSLDKAFIPTEFYNLIPKSELQPKAFADMIDFTYGFVSSAEILANPVVSGASDVFSQTGSLDSFHVDLTAPNGIVDIKEILSSTCCSTVDEVVSKVNSGELSVSDVYSAVGAVPYVDVVADTGAIAVPGDVAVTRPVALAPDLSIPADLTIADTYTPALPLDSSPSGKFTFPLAEFFPFCLPWDIYKVLKVFNAKPKAPVITIPLGSFFSSIPGVDKSTTDYVFTFDLGEDQFEKWFIILRNLEKIGIVIGFVLVSRQLIHGGD